MKVKLCIIMSGLSAKSPGYTARFSTFAAQTLQGSCPCLKIKETYKTLITSSRNNIRNVHYFLSPIFTYSHTLCGSRYS